MLLAQSSEMTLKLLEYIAYSVYIISAILKHHLKWHQTVFIKNLGLENTS